MTLEERVAGMEARLGKNDTLVIELREAVTATAYMEARHSRALKDHSEWLSEHDKAITDSRKEFDERMKALDERIAGLVSAFGEYIRRH
jgi:uncharacterized coiled-coil protein SlyX